MSWSYEPVGPNGGAGGDAYKSVFNGAGKDPAATLAREAVQNSVDAATDPFGSVRVDFRFSKLAKKERDRFFAAAGLAQMSPRLEHLGLVHENCLSQPEAELELLYVEDYGTTGLAGDPTHPSSNLRKLLMDLGGSVKSRFLDGDQFQGSGGSYGFGKAVYSANSKIGAIFVFSRTTDADGSPLSVLMGSAYQSEHEIGGKIYTGRAWLGRPFQTPDNGLRFDPFTGEEAEGLATSLGFARDEGLGTSILIIDTDINPDHLIHGLEDNWWPRIQSRLLDVEVLTDTGDRITPQPRKRLHLKPFIQAWDVANGPAPEESMERKQVQYNRAQISYPEPRALSIGKLGLVSLQEVQDDFPLGEEHDDLVNTIALVRSPMMVVKYHSTGRSRSALSNVVGCFMADRDIDEVLRLSEPPPHDDWDPAAQRLKVRSNDYPAVVKSVLDRIKRSFKEFQKSASPPDPFNERRLSAVERLLAQWFGPSGASNSGPNPSASPIHLVPDGPKLELTDAGLVASGVIKISLGESAIEKGRLSVPIRLHLTLKVGEEDGVSSVDPIQFDLEVERGEIKLDEQAGDKPSEKPTWVGSVRKGEPIRVKFKSKPYDPSWTIKMVPVVTEAKSEGVG